MCGRNGAIRGRRNLHSLLAECLSAVIACFSLTATLNWTGRLPLQDGPLAILGNV